MAETPLYQLRFPTGDDTPNVPRDMFNLAADVESKLGALWATVNALPTSITDANAASAVKIRTNATQSIPTSPVNGSGTAVWYPVTFAAANALWETSWFNATYPSRITPNVAGIYTVCVGVEWNIASNNTAATRGLRVTVNGTVFGGQSMLPGVSGDYTPEFQTLTCAVAVNGSSDYIQAEVTQCSGVAVVLNPTQTLGSMSAVWNGHL